MNDGNKKAKQSALVMRVVGWGIGCRMATDASRGVVDFRGEVFGHPGLYVADASVFPTMTIGGPQLSVSALASWIAERIAKDPA